MEWGLWGWVGRGRPVNREGGYYLCTKYISPQWYTACTFVIFCTFVHVVLPFLDICTVFSMCSYFFVGFSYFLKVFHACVHMFLTFLTVFLTFETPVNWKNKFVVMKKAVSEFSTNFRMYSYSIFVYSMPHIHVYIYIYTHNPRKRLWTIYYSSHVYTFTHAYLYIQANEMAQIFGSQKLDGTKADAISMNINLDRYHIDLSRYTIDLDRYCIDLNR